MSDDWRYGRMTVTWPLRVGGWWRAVGIVRVHDDEAVIPGPYNCAAAIVVRDGLYEVMGFVAKREPPTHDEFRAFYGHLSSLGLTKLRHIRAKVGRTYEVPPVSRSPCP